MIDGKKIDLKPLDSKYDDDMRAIRNSLEVLTLSGSQNYAPATDIEHDRWLKEMALSGKGKYQFAIIEKSSKVVGSIGLFDFDWISRKAKLQLRIAKTHWGKGYGTEAVGLICRYAFSVLNLGRVYLEVAGSNTRAISVYNKLGFKEEGIMRRHVFVAGEYGNAIIMGLLPEELEFDAPEPVG